MRTQVVKLFIVTFFFSIVYSFSTDFPINATSFDKGVAAGTIFGQAIKIIGIAGLILFGFKRYRKQRWI